MTLPRQSVGHGGGSTKTNHRHNRTEQTKMKTPKLLLLAALALVVWLPAFAQSLPDDLIAVGTNGYPTPPTAWFSMANWPAWPPFPLNSLQGDEYYSPSYGADTIFVDDLLATYNRFERNGINPWEPGDPIDTNAVASLDVTNWPPPPDPQTDHTNLLIGIIDVTNMVSGWYADLIVYNTTNTASYEILSSTNVLAAMTNWHSEGVWAGIVSNTPARVPWLDRTNQLFFRARVFDGNFANGFPQNGTLVIQLANTGPLVALVNHVSNSIPTLASNFIVLHPPLWEVNVGYDASDGASETNFLTPWPSNYNILNVYGRSDTISNLVLSYSGLTNIDTHGWQNLYILECWHCTNMLAPVFTNCPRLHRVCFESIDNLLHGFQVDFNFTGCTNIADMRAANNAFRNIIWGPGGGSNLFHFCTRDSHANQFTLPYMVGLPFANLPSLKQLWIWADGSFPYAVNLAYTNSPQLESLEAFNNEFYGMNLYGQVHLTNAVVYNCYLTNMNIVGCSNLIDIEAYDNFMTSASIDNMLVTLDQMGKSNGGVFLKDVSPLWANGAPSSVGLAASVNLTNKHWVVLFNDPATVVPRVENVFTTPGSNDCAITWTTLNIAANSTIYWGTNTASNSTNDPTKVTSHSMTLTGLNLDTVYRFSVASSQGTNTGRSSTNSFRTLGHGPNTNRIYFVTTSSNASMQAWLGGTGKMQWVWGDGTTNTITGTNNSHFTNLYSTALVRTNYLVVDPAEALIQFGVECQDNPDVQIATVDGLANYPNLEGLYFYYTGLTNMSLAGLTNLTYVAAAATAPGAAMENQWFIDIANAQSNIGHITPEGWMCTDSAMTFYAPSGYDTNSSYSYQNTMTNVGWNLLFLP
jgi:hypothetical protein